MPPLTLRSGALQVFLVVFSLMALGTWYQHYIVPLVTEPHWNDDSTAPEAIAPEDHVFGKHIIRQDGLLEVNMAGRHPIWDLIEDGERRWVEMKARQSKTLQEAVTEYVRRNGYQPPAGFDMWWDFTQKHNVMLVDEFDQINYDITPYLALSPSTFRARAEALSDPDHAYHLNITNGHVNIYGPQWWEGNQRQLASMVMGFSRAMPDLEIHGYERDRGDTWIGADLRKEADAKARAGQYFTEDELRHFESIERNEQWGLKNVCLPDDPIFNVTQPSGAPTFIKSPLAYLSPCSSPGIHRAQPLIFTPDPKTLRLHPHFVFAKQRPDSGFLFPTNFWDWYSPLLVTPHPWEKRRDDGVQKLFWRGAVTGWNWFKGIVHSDPGVTWRDGARTKLALSFSVNLGPGQEVDVLMENNERDGSLVSRKYERAWLNERWMDVGLSGSPIQCSQEDGTCDEMRDAPMWKEPHAEHKEPRKKFSIDVDSNTWSWEFQRKLSWGHVVLKATSYPEWHTQWLIPYYHYIPIQSDYSDVYNIMGFFLGDPETGIGGHDELAEQIGRHASEFARKNWRWEDMQAYLYRLILEYVRLGCDDREAASFRL